MVAMHHDLPARAGNTVSTRRHAPTKMLGDGDTKPWLVGPWLRAKLAPLANGSAGAGIYCASHWSEPPTPGWA